MKVNFSFPRCARNDFYRLWIFDDIFEKVWIERCLLEYDDCSHMSSMGNSSYWFLSLAQRENLS